ncbi:GNAT family N-acetyltransferase [Ignavigranum ruoffiae]|uniref:GNAT family N-acetyltransferase n=1 Tax=Ignavigranum ruoffiae TaxID=89093 RepID=UPI0024AD7675|nr:GNAT family N-acetyltransferase [Ignavigranum ruoffiae]
MNVSVSFGDHSPIYQAARSIRQSVFVREQGIDPDIEWDKLDGESYHFVAYLDQTPVATCRLHLDTDSSRAHLQRFAVTLEARQQSVGRALLTQMEAWAKDQGIDYIYLSAQQSALPFYLKSNYQQSKEPAFIEAGIPHQNLYKWLA